ncbi:MFS transporter [Kitasatospora sp. NPDC051853]|uniref:MFS transporter n=1 Tax=Kitasatospora sp. NPDC051853 TaxID=3364058 RepID=UPI0037950669
MKRVSTHPTSSQSVPPPPDEPSAPAGAAAPPASAASPGRWQRLRRLALADLSPLRDHPDYRRVWTGQVVSAVGQQMTAVAVSVQVYRLTESTFATGLVGLFSLVPLIVLGLFGGAIADTVDRRLLGLLGAAGLAATSAVLAVQALLDLRSVPLLYAMVAVQAGFFALSSPARSAMIPRLVPAHQLPAANALGSMSMNLGTTVGPMIGGLLIGASGVQSAYLIDTLAFSGILYAMWRLPAMLPGDGTADTTRKRASVLDGLRFLRSRPNLRTSFVADLIAMLLASPRALFPAVALTVYHGGPGTVGLLMSAPAVGALAGALFSGWITRVHRHGAAIVAGVAAWGLAIAVFGLSNHLWLGLLALGVAGAADSVSMIFRNTILQVGAPDDMRGRLQGVFIVVVAGGPRLGDFFAGTTASLTSTTTALLIGGLACVAAILLLAARRPAFLRYDARHPTP